MIHSIQIGLVNSNWSDRATIHSTYDEIQEVIEKLLQQGKQHIQNFSVPLCNGDYYTFRFEFSVPHHQKVGSGWAPLDSYSYAQIEYEAGGKWRMRFNGRKVKWTIKRAKFDKWVKDFCDNGIVPS